MAKPSIIVYFKPFCPWTQGVMNVLEKYGLEFEPRDIVRNSADYEEMVRKSGQYSAPCVEIDGHMLADVGGDEVEAWMRQKDLIPASD